MGKVITLCTKLSIDHANLTSNVKRKKITFIAHRNLQKRRSIIERKGLDGNFFS